MNFEFDFDYKETLLHKQILNLFIILSLHFLFVFLIIELYICKGENFMIYLLQLMNRLPIKPIQEHSKRFPLIKDEHIQELSFLIHLRSLGHVCRDIIWLPSIILMVSILIIYWANIFWSFYQYNEDKVKLLFQPKLGFLFLIQMPTLILKTKSIKQNWDLHCPKFSIKFHWNILQ